MSKTARLAYLDRYLVAAFLFASPFHLLRADEGNQVATSGAGGMVVEIESMELWSNASGLLLELSLSAASDSIAMGHESDGSIVVHLPNHVPGPRVSDISTNFGLVEKVEVEDLYAGGEPWTRITVRTRGAASYTVNPGENPLRVRFLRLQETERSDETRATGFSAPQTSDGRSVVRVVVDSCLNLRIFAGTGSPALTCLSPGTRLTVLDEVNGWKQVRLPSGLEGWVAEAFVRAE